MEQIQIAVDTTSLGVEETVLEVKDLSVTRSGKLVLEDINLEIKSGEFVGLVGPNGSGKSTLMLSILGILKAQKGSVRIYGSPPMSRNQIGKRLGSVANLKKEIRITVEELVRHGMEEQYSAVENARNGRTCVEIIKRLLGHWHHADFILLDEPLVGIDRMQEIHWKLLDNLCHDEGKPSSWFPTI